MDDIINTHPPYDFIQGALLPVDKPLEWTSFDVVNKIKYKLKQTLQVKKIKVGHSGTLDPLATGLLLVAAGPMTKKLKYLTDMDKVYSGTIQLGSSTPSFDKETEIDTRYPTNHITFDLIEENLEKFTGEIEQEVPRFSAVRVKGKRLYHYARKSEQVVAPRRKVEIKSFECLNFDPSEYTMDFRVRCSKGTYIRSLAHDFGQYLNSGGHLSRLKREKIGPYSLSEAHSLNDLLDLIEKSAVIKRDD
ncbi:MAG TPA: tRNA pseudouridine(55) synthase TruB [Saprospiraceae bacterium]|nr:tRNA pseudouridine(55) synthase TruB [Saprospiraceae bacterium]